MTRVLENEVVVAGAGTGKTHALVNDYLFTLLGLDGTGRVRSPHRVLAITFTDKAAAEMRRRVALRLSDLVRSPAADDDVVRRSAEVEGQIPDGETLERLLRQLPGAPIATFHSLAASLLRDLALVAHLDPGFEQLDEVEERLLLEETAEAVVLDRLAEGDAEVAELAARFQLRRLGGGAGLVEGLCDLYTSLAERGRTSAQVQPLVGPEAAAERVSRARLALYEHMRSLQTALREDDNAGQWTKERLATLTDRFERLREALDGNEGDEQEIRVASAFTRLLKEDGDWGSSRVRPVRLDAFAALHELGAALCDRAAAGHAVAVRALLIDLDRRVHDEKHARGVLGFGDLLLKARDVLRDEPSVRARVKARFDRILVDEFQDTSPVQEDLIALLAEDPTRGDRVAEGEPAMEVLRLGRGRLFVVGDPKQSIYGFRGAEAGLFQHTLKVVTEGTEALPPTGRRSSLTTSYRSRPPVVEAVNLVAEATLAEGLFGVPFDEGDRLRAHRAGEGRAGALLRPITERGADLDEAEAWVIARKIRELLDDGLPVSDEGRPLRAGDITVLVRRIKTAGPVARALAHVGVPAHITGGEGFFSRPEVMDCVAALRLVVEPDDELAALTVLRSPLVGLTDDEMVRLHQASDRDRQALRWSRLREALPGAVLEPGSAERLLAFGELLASLRDSLGEVPLPRLLDRLLDESGYALAIGIEPDAPERLANLDKLRVLGEGRVGEAVAAVGRLWGFLDNPPREAAATTVGPEVDAVRLMTVHQAKGLEFPVVFLADLGSKLFADWGDLAWEADTGLAVSYRGRPVAVCDRSSQVTDASPALKRVQARKGERDQAELARLLYVAMTRARDHLFLVGEERTTGAWSLRRLYEKARTLSRGRLDELLPIEKVMASAPPARALPVEELPAEVSAPTAGFLSPIRVPPSALGRAPAEAARGAPSHAPAEDGTAPRTTSELDADEERRRRGRLAHQVIARAGQEADAARLADPDEVRFITEVCLRAEGEEPESTRWRDVVRRCGITLGGPVRELLARGYELSFEEHLRCTWDAGGHPAVVIGTADLVARGPEDTLVVDFKSSPRAAADERTWLQLAAYAAALEDRGEGPVRLASWVVGDEVALDDARDFDASLREELARALVAAVEAALPA